MLSELWYRLRAVVRRGAMERELEEELRAHAEHAAARGRESREDVERVKEACREERGVWWWETLRQDGRYAWRQMRRRPALAASAVVALALGTGLNLALFRVVWGVMLKPLPYAQPEQLVELWGQWDEKTAAMVGQRTMMPHQKMWEWWEEQAKTLSGVAAYRVWTVTATGPLEPERLDTLLVTPGYFPLLGARPAQGRVFTKEDDRRGAAGTAVVSERFWRRVYGGRPLSGRETLAVDGRMVAVIGVLGRDEEAWKLASEKEVEVYLPLVWNDAERRVTLAFVAGRMRPRVTVQAAQRELAELSRRPEAPRGVRNGVEVRRFGAGNSLVLKQALRALFALAGCVWLIACFSVANLLLAQALARRQELAIRAALGAGRGRLLRQLGLEAGLLAASGTVAGLGLGWVAERLLRVLGPGFAVSWSGDGAATMVTLFACGLAVAATVVVGLLPAWVATSEGAGLNGTRATAGRRAGLWTKALVAGQVGFTAVVLVCAGLLLESFVKLRAVDPGFTRERVVTAALDLPAAMYPKDEDRVKFARGWMERVAALPGVEMAGLTSGVPLGYRFTLGLNLKIPGLEKGAAQVTGRTVAGDYFRTLGLRIKMGRALTAEDAWRKDVAVVNEAYVRRYLKGRPVLGTVLSQEEDTQVIVGVAADFHGTRLQDAAQPEVYLPLGAAPFGHLEVAVRSRLATVAVTEMLRGALREYDPKLALDKTVLLEDLVDEQLEQPRLQAYVVGLFAVVALVLALVGVYGVVAQSVRARTAEIGVRQALGATKGRIVKAVLGQGLVAPLMGLVVGLGGAALGSRYLATLLYGVEPGDGRVYGLCGVALAGASLLSCLLPARAASRVDPARVLREE